MKQIVIGIGAALVVAYVAILVFGGGTASPATSSADPDNGQGIGQPVVQQGPSEDAFDGASQLKPTALREAAAQFNLNTALTLKNVNGLVRFMLNASGDGANGYAVDMTSRSARLVLVQDGIEQTLAVTDDLDLQLAKAHRILVKRRRLPLTLVVNDRVVLRTEDDTFSSGAVTAAGAHVELADAMVQATEDIYKTEDFMSTAKEGAATWTPTQGNWVVHSVDHPVLSANPFSYRVTGEGPCTTIVGSPFWDDYLFEASFNAPKARAVGMMFYYDERDGQPFYYLLRWDSAEVDGAKVSLLKVEGGQSTVLREAPGGFVPDQWYRMKVRVLGTTAEVYVSGRRVFEAPVVDDALVGGKVGLYAEDAEMCFFDDVYVRSIQSVDGIEATRTGQWASVGGGSWRQLDDGRSLAVECPEAEAMIVRGGLQWKNYTVDSRLTPGDASVCGIAFGYHNPINMYRVEIDSSGPRRMLKLVKVTSGRSTTLDEPVALPEADAYRLTVRTRGDYLGVLLDGRTVLDAFEKGYRGGKVSLFASGATQAAPALYGDLSIDFANERPPKLAASESHQAEVTMTVWNRDWQSMANAPSGMTEAYIHKQDFRGNEKTVEGQVTALPDDKSAVGLSVCGTPESLDRSYWMVLRGGDTWQVELHRAGQVIRTQPVSDMLRKRLASMFAADPRVKGNGFMMKLTRIGKGYLLLYLENDCVLAYRDPEPLEGLRPGYFTQGAAMVNSEKVTVDSPLTFNDSFRQATDDWRVQSGIWEVTNRWECDPRWSFFSGRPSTEALAAIWHKRSFSGDLSVDFYVGPMMLRGTLGDYNNYIRDFNVTLNADGKDLSSGYTFSLGSLIDGKRNAGSRIIRGDKVIAENTTSPWARIAPRKGAVATASLHRQWFHVQARLRHQDDGSVNLELWVDGHKVCEAVDSQPLPGDRVAIWTCNCGIMVSRVRISSTDPGEMEPYDFPASTQCRHFYTGEELLKVKWTNPRKNN